MLELIRQRLEQRQSACSMGDRLREQPVGEPRVAGPQRPVEVGADRPAEAAAFVATLSVVAEPGHDASEGLGAWIENRPPGVILEAGKGSFRPGLKLAFEQDVADHATRPGNGVEWQQPDSGLLSAALIAIEASQQLIATAHREKGGAAREGIV